MKKGILYLLAVLLLGIPVAVRADLETQTGYCTVHDENGAVLLRIAGSVQIGDEYISSDNRRYRIVQADAAAGHAAAVFVEDVILPEAILAAQAQEWIPKIALYCTHTDESYVEGDGSESIAEGGGILDIAGLLTQELNESGCEAILDETNHVPHDAGAYRRSRKTAVSLMKEEFPTLLLDVHRDAVPEDEYLHELDGEELSSVRIVIGRGNANYPANEELAKTIKAVADKRYPGLIKDIYMGKGDYNQDLMARSLLLEFGSHETDKQMAEKSTAYLAEVLSVTLGANTSPAEPTPGISPVPGVTQAPKENRSAPAAPSEEGGNEDRGAMKGIGILLGILALAGIGIAAFFVRKGNRGESALHLLREMTGVGSRPDPDREERK